MSTTRQRGKAGSPLIAVRAIRPEGLLDLRRVWSLCGRREISAAVFIRSTGEVRRIQYGPIVRPEGFEGWSQVHLFDDRMPLFKDGQPVRPGRDDAVRNTAHVMRHWVGAWRWPSEIQQSLDFRPRNPDIVAYRKGKPPEWRFCEVKGPGDRCTGGHFIEQLNALAVLRLLTGSPVAIVRPVEQVRRPRSPRTSEARHGIQTWSAVGPDLPLAIAVDPAGWQI